MYNQYTNQPSKNREKSSFSNKQQIPQYIQQKNRYKNPPGTFQVNTESRQPKPYNKSTKTPAQFLPQHYNSHHQNNSYPYHSSYAHQSPSILHPYQSAHSSPYPYPLLSKYAQRTSLSLQIQQAMRGGRRNAGRVGNDSDLGVCVQGEPHMEQDYGHLQVDGQRKLRRNRSLYKEIVVDDKQAIQRIGILCIMSQKQSPQKKRRLSTSNLHKNINITKDRRQQKPKKQSKCQLAVTKQPKLKQKQKKTEKIYSSLNQKAEQKPKYKTKQLRRMATAGTSNLQGECQNYVDVENCQEVGNYEDAQWDGDESDYEFDLCQSAEQSTQQQYQVNINQKSYIITTKPYKSQKPQSPAQTQNSQNPQLPLSNSSPNPSPNPNIPESVQARLKDIEQIMQIERKNSRDHNQYLMSVIKKLQGKDRKNKEVIAMLTKQIEKLNEEKNGYMMRCMQLQGYLSCVSTRENTILKHSSHVFMEPQIPVQINSQTSNPTDSNNQTLNYVNFSNMRALPQQTQTQLFQHLQKNLPQNSIPHTNSNNSITSQAAYNLCSSSQVNLPSSTEINNALIRRKSSHTAKKSNTSNMSDPSIMFNANSSRILPDTNNFAANLNNSISGYCVIRGLKNQINSYEGELEELYEEADNGREFKDGKDPRKGRVLTQGMEDKSILKEQSQESSRQNETFSTIKQTNRVKFQTNHVNSLQLSVSHSHVQGQSYIHQQIKLQQQSQPQVQLRSPSKFELEPQVQMQSQTSLQLQPQLAPSLQQIQSQNSTQSVQQLTTRFQNLMQQYRITHDVHLRKQCVKLAKRIKELKNQMLMSRAPSNYDYSSNDVNYGNGKRSGSGSRSGSGNGDDDEALKEGGGRNRSRRERNTIQQIIFGDSNQAM